MPTSFFLWLFLLVHLSCTDCWAFWMPEEWPSIDSGVKREAAAAESAAQQPPPAAGNQVLDPSQLMPSFTPKNGTSSRCFVAEEQKLTSYAQWATKRNRTHSIALMAPSDIPMRQIGDSELEGNSAEDGAPLLAGSRAECPTEIVLTIDEKGDLMARSLCPWYWQANIDSNRMPQILPEAKCRCKRAVTGRNDVAYDCHEMKMDVRVLRLDNSCNGYREHQESISIACVATVLPPHLLEKVTGIEQQQVHQDTYTGGNDAQQQQQVDSK